MDAEERFERVQVGVEIMAHALAVVADEGRTSLRRRDPNYVRAYADTQLRLARDVMAGETSLQEARAIHAAVRDDA